MPSLDIPISRVPPSGRAPTAGPSRSIIRDMERAGRGEESARAIVGRGIQQLGAGIGAIGEKLHNQLVGDQSLFSKIEYETGMQKFLVEVDNTRHVKDGIPQWDKILEQGNARNKELIEGISKLLVPEAKEAFQFYAQQRKLAFDKILDGKIQGIRKNFITEILPVEIGRIARSGDWETAYNLLNEFKATILDTGDIPESQLLLFDKAFDKGTVRGAIGHDLSPEYIEQLIKESDSLTQEEKASLRREAKATIATRQREQKEALEAKQDETASKMLLKLIRNELTYDEVETALEKNWLTDSQTKSLWASLLDPTVPKTDYLKALENVNEAISDFRKDPEKKREAIDAIYDNLRNISRGDSKLLLNEIEEMSIPDSALNRSDAKRAVTVLEELKDIRVSMLRAAMKDDPTITSDTLREELLQQYQMKNDLEQWILKKDRTTDEIEKKVELMTSPIATDIVLSWFERLMWSKGQRQFLGLIGTEEERLAKKITKTQIGGLPRLKGFTTEKEIPEPKTLTEFEDTVLLLDEEEAKAYYEKWKNKW